MYEDIKWSRRSSQMDNKVTDGSLTHLHLRKRWICKVTDRLHHSYVQKRRGTPQRVPHTQQLFPHKSG